MESLYYTIVAILLYFVADWILQRIEVIRGTRLEQRSIIFFVILLTLAVTSFALIRQFIIFK
jgi:hypothetical protein